MLAFLARRLRQTKQVQGTIGKEEAESSAFVDVLLSFKGHKRFLQKTLRSMFTFNKVPTLTWKSGSFSIYPQRTYGEKTVGDDPT